MEFIRCRKSVRPVGALSGLLSGISGCDRIRQLGADRDKTEQIYIVGIHTYNGCKNTLLYVSDLLVRWPSAARTRYYISIEMQFELKIMDITQLFRIKQ